LVFVQLTHCHDSTKHVEIDIVNVATLKNMFKWNQNEDHQPIFHNIHMC
jgi:hypothetical protein